MPDSWLKNAIKNASQIIFECLALKKSDVLPVDASCRLLAIIEATCVSTSLIPICDNTSFAAGKSFLLVINQRGLSGTPITIAVYINDGTANTPSIQRQSFKPPTPCKK